MSQNILVTSSSIGTVRVRAGWDNPLQEIFCNVEALEKTIELDEAPACLLQTSYPDMQVLLASLKEAQIVLPRQMIEAIVLDVELRAGNIVRIFQPDGSADGQ